MALTVREELADTPVISAFSTAVELLEAERASLLLRPAGEASYAIVASVGISSSLAATVRVRPGRGVAGVVAERGTSLLGSVANQTFLSVPVMTEKGVEGILNFSERRGAQPYTSQDMTRASRVAGHIAQLIEFDRLVLRDPLTGLHNRRALDDTLEREIARSRRLSTSLAVVFVDVDGLKQINDEQGHQEGDAALQAVSTALEGLLRTYDFAARYGGDEFVVLLTDLEQGHELSAEHIKDRVFESLFVASKECGLDLSASVGVAYWPADGNTAEEVLHVADERMYQAKRSR